MKIYAQENVFEAALARIRWLFSEFPNVIVGDSGGKDSTVVFHLALQVAREMGRLPLRVMWLDQEAEWQATVDQVRSHMEHPDVEPRWYQIPFRLFNATSSTEHWLNCWAPDEEARWMRPRESYSVHDNIYGIDRFRALFDAIPAIEYPDTPTCYICGVRTEESPARFIGLTHQRTYKWATWGTRLSRGRHHYTMYPIYDWSYTDVWAAIHKNGWRYNAIYDAQFQHGVSVKNMRVSNVHHETAVHSLFYLQELEPETWNRLTARIAGIDMAGKMGAADYFVSELPFMFASWRQYRDHLLDHLVTNPAWHAAFVKEFARLDALYLPAVKEMILARLQIASILTNDWEFIKMDNWERSPAIYRLRRQLTGKSRW